VRFDCKDRLWDSEGFNLVMIQTENFTIKKYYYPCRVFGFVWNKNRSMAIILSDGGTFSIFDGSKYSIPIAIGGKIFGASWAPNSSVIAFCTSNGLLLVKLKSLNSLFIELPNSILKLTAYIVFNFKEAFLLPLIVIALALIFKPKETITMTVITLNLSVITATLLLLLFMKVSLILYIIILIEISVSIYLLAPIKHVVVYLLLIFLPLFMIHCLWWTLRIPHWLYAALTPFLTLCSYAAASRPVPKPKPPTWFIIQSNDKRLLLTKAGLENEKLCFYKFNFRSLKFKDKVFEIPIEEIEDIVFNPFIYEIPVTIVHNGKKTRVTVINDLTPLLDEILSLCTEKSRIPPYKITVLNEKLKIQRILEILRDSLVGLLLLFLLILRF